MARTAARTVLYRALSCPWELKLPCVFLSVLHCRGHGGVV